MGGMECVITGLMDEFHNFFKVSKYSREIFTFCAVAVSFSIALVNVTPVSKTIFIKCKYFLIVFTPPFFFVFIHNNSSLIRVKNEDLIFDPV